MKKLTEMMKQAQEMQSRMGEMQEALAQAEIDGSAGAGMVTVTLSGKGDMKRVKIDPSLARSDEVEILEDLIIAAHNDAKLRVEEHAAEEMKKITGGLQLPPGMDMPF
ncbi:MAG: YbaB/EbfC family nucleoid-associated protein [Alphaproteobacteria bacterium]